MSSPEVKLELVLSVNGIDKIVDSIDYTETVRDLLENPDLDFTEDMIFDYVMEVRDKM